MSDKKDKLIYDSVQTIEGLEYQRKRAYVNMGSTDSVDGKMPRALLQMAQEIVSNSVDEALSGFGDEILITIHPDRSMTVLDHGRGLPRDLIEKDGTVVKFESAIRSFTKPGTSGKFDNTGYKNSGGLNGIGAKGTTALSEWVEVEVQTTKKQHYKFKITYDNWIKNEEPDYKEELDFNDDLGTFTKVTFLPDKRVLASTNWQRKALCDRYEMASYLVPNVKITLIDEREFDDETDQYWQKSWLSKNGLKDYINTLSEGSKALKGLKEPITFADNVETSDGFNIEIHGALRWIDNLGAMTQSFVNGIPTIEGGPHLQGALRGINDAIRDYTKDKKKLSLSPSDIQEGLIIALEIKVPEPLMQFEGQTKEKYGSAAALPATKKVVGEALTKWLYDNNDSAENLIEKMAESASLREKAVQARKDAKAARDRKKNDKNKLLVSSKLTKAIEKDPKKRELFICEGDSACFVGDTKVRLADGRDLEIKNIVKEFEQGKKLYIYSQTDSVEDNDGVYQNKHFQVMPIKWAGKTRTNAELIRVYIDNNSYVDCTPDHKFLMIDGTYKMAKDLKPDDSLSVMINKNDDPNGYIVLPKQKKIYQNVVDMYYPNSRKKGLHVHHKDGNKKNNTPENLQVLTSSEHGKITARQMAEQGQSFGERTSRLYATNPAYRARQKEIQAYGGRCGKGSKHNQLWDEKQRLNTSITTSQGMKKISKERWQEMRRSQVITCGLAFFKLLLDKGISFEEIKTAHLEHVAYLEVSDDGVKYKNRNKITYWKHKFYDRISVKTINYDKLKEHFNSDEELLDAIKNANHRVVKIEKLDKKEDVYDLHVEHTHNFVLSNDVVVHNCGTIVQSRNRNQAVFPIRGKMLNTLDVPLSRILKNEEITTIASVLGAGIGPAFDVEDLQYDKVIIASDSDDDGYHIRCLIITMIHRCFPELIQNGHLYIAESPLFRLAYYEKGEQFNKYAFTEDEKNKVYKELSKKHKDINVTRFKGLGESNPEDLKFAMITPETRHLIQVTLNDLGSAEKYLRINMGKDATLRKNWVMDNMDFSIAAYENM